MINNFKCLKCKQTFEKVSTNKYEPCPYCYSITEKQFRATSNLFVPGWFHQVRSDIFSDKEWEDLRKDPNTERYK
jgi:protein-arginine kinase activator protein McsA